MRGSANASSSALPLPLIRPSATFSPLARGEKEFPFLATPARGGHLERHGRPPRAIPRSRPDRAERARRSRRALARDFPPHRRILPRQRRAGRFAPPLAHPADATVAGLRTQRHAGPGRARPRLCAAYQRRPVADRDRPALLRRRALADRRLRSRTSAPASKRRCAPPHAARSRACSPRRRASCPA